MAQERLVTMSKKQTNQEMYMDMPRVYEAYHFADSVPEPDGSEDSKGSRGVSTTGLTSKEIQKFLGREDIQRFLSGKPMNRTMELIEKLVDDGFTRKEARNYVRKLKKLYAPKKKAQKKMGGGKVYSRGSRKASYNA